MPQTEKSSMCSLTEKWQVKIKVGTDYAVRADFYLPFFVRYPIKTHVSFSVAGFAQRAVGLFYPAESAMKNARYARETAERWAKRGGKNKLL